MLINHGLSLTVTCSLVWSSRRWRWPCGSPLPNVSGELRLRVWVIMHGWSGLLTYGRSIKLKCSLAHFIASVTRCVRRRRERQPEGQSPVWERVGAWLKGWVSPRGNGCNENEMCQWSWMRSWMLRMNISCSQILGRLRGRENIRGVSEMKQWVYVLC